MHRLTRPHCRAMSNLLVYPSPSEVKAPHLLSMGRAQPSTKPMHMPLSLLRVSLGWEVPPLCVRTARKKKSLGYYNLFKVSQLEYSINYFLRLCQSGKPPTGEEAGGEERAPGIGGLVGSAAVAV